MFTVAITFISKLTLCLMYCNQENYNVIMFYYIINYDIPINRRSDDRRMQRKKRGTDNANEQSVCLFCKDNRMRERRGEQECKTRIRMNQNPRLKGKLSIGSKRKNRGLLSLSAPRRQRSWKSLRRRAGSEARTMP